MTTPPARNQPASYEHDVEDFEKRHPGILIKDLLDRDKLLEEDTPFARKLNQLKQNLVTIEQTSGYKSNDAYVWLLPFHFNIGSV
jgi:hypothetical protein